MESDPQIIEAQFAELSLRLATIERRLTALERGRATSAPAERAAAVPPDQPGRQEAAGRPVSELLPIIGRTVLIIGGAFLLRAITEAGWLGLGTGAAAGIAYAVVWIVLAHRTALTGHRLHATLFGTAATIIAYPLLWETTVSFKSLAPPAAAAAIVAITVFALAVCWRDRLHGLAWVVTLAGGSAAIALAIATRRLPLFLGALLLVGLATLWIGWSRDWKGLAAAIAVPAHAGVLLITMITILGDEQVVAALFDPWTVIGVQVALVVVYLGSLVVRTLTSHREFGGAEITLGVMATVVGLGGAMAVVRVTGVGAAALGVVALAMAAGSYAASFTLIDRRQTGRTNFVFYTTLALACTLVGFEALLEGVPLTAAFAVAAVVAAWAGSRWERATLSGHGAIYAAAATVVSGLLGLAVDAFSSPTPTSLRAIGWAVWIALAVVVGCNAFQVPTHGRTWGRLSWFPKLTFIGVALVGLAGVAVSTAASLVTSGADGAAAALAVVRTGALAVAAVLLAWLGGRERFREAGWFVYPVLIAAVIKLFVEDFRVGSPATMVLSLALLGGAMILAPRIAGHGSSRAGDSVPE